MFRSCSLIGFHSCFHFLYEKHSEYSYSGGQFKMWLLPVYKCGYCIDENADGVSWLWINCCGGIKINSHTACSQLSVLYGSYRWKLKKIKEFTWAHSLPGQKKVALFWWAYAMSPHLSRPIALIHFDDGIGPLVKVLSSISQRLLLGLRPGLWWSIHLWKWCFILPESLFHNLRLMNPEIVILELGEKTKSIN